MAREEMVVVQIKGSKVLVQRERTSACGSCPAHMLCTGDKQFASIEADKNGFDVQPGDHVIVEIPNVSGVKTALLLYTFPTIVFIGTLIIASKFLTEVYGLFLAIAAVGCYYFFVKHYDKKFRKNFRPKIIGLVKDSSTKDLADDASLR
ncbi:SoxR reducing system RseC family protein [Pseudothermotoga thermarum]|uniref:Positive regulator of sigma E, RseC/MucC n=1 Tax=Pseudothermotoga thermarum DSM 5069 TaxID=688269 RepID=F7YW10_9THEM|nr:SoxR reducing system RseC family protein [Pseudothermotoga thermarum]AEH50497.1 positive regulator of sigma E, RseC/MucC [Pseudothermotoga thermarum DSM 5069]